MNRLMASFLAGAFLLSAPLATVALGATGEVPATPTRIVIAPPQSELARVIKAGLAAAYYGAGKDTKAYAEGQKLYFFYGERHFEPLWLVKSANGTVAFSPAAQKIMAVFEKAALEGLRPSDYLTAGLDLAGAGDDPAKLAQVETAFSASAMRYAQNAYGGRIKPSSVSATFDIAPRRIDEADMLMKLSASDDPDQILLALDPKHPEFVRLKAALAKFENAGADQPVMIPEGKTLKPGMSDPRVALLRTRLDIPVPTDGAEVIYDDTVVQAVQAFQDSLGLQADGIAGPATVAALNGGSATSKDDIIANMERWRWMPEDLGAFNVFVNIPEFKLAVVKNGQETYTTRVVVGTPEHQTVVFSDAIRHIVVNPYWNVPPSIANNEIAPKLATNPGYIDSQNMELLSSGGQVINASAIDWSQVPAGKFPFRIRQRPGGGNALGAVKFLFPNVHDIYLHDTPSKSLFQRSFRAYSHGCVRVQNPMEFADALLVNEPKLNAAALEALYGPAERWVNLETHVPVHLTYFTLRADEDGTIRSYGDVYGLNKRLISLLNQ
jgi:murein L,D-transpeptidase YcbB/YkuD